MKFSEEFIAFLCESTECLSKIKVTHLIRVYHKRGALGEWYQLRLNWLDQQIKTKRLQNKLAKLSHVSSKIIILMAFNLTSVKLLVIFMSQNVWVDFYRIRRLIYF